jgi:hypothetical protein
MSTEHGLGQSDTSRLSAGDYLGALIHEHESLRAEIQSTMSSRNSGLIALSVALIGVLVKVNPFNPGNLTPLWAHILLYGLLPLLLLAFGLLQAIATAQTERIGCASKLVEMKINYLFATNGTSSLVTALGKMNKRFQAELGDSRQWSAPIQWEHLVRSSKRGLYKEPFWRSLLTMLPAPLLSIAVTGLLTWKVETGDIRWWWIGCAGGISIAAAIAFSFYLKRYHDSAVWSSIRGKDWVEAR